MALPPSPPKPPTKPGGRIAGPAPEDIRFRTKLLQEVEKMEKRLEKIRDYIESGIEPFDD